MKHQDDALLIAAARDGDEGAFGQLVERYKEGVYATLVAITGDFDVARDIAQEAFVRAWLGLGRLEEASSFGPWLRTIARNRGRTWLERSRRQPVQEELAVDRIAHDGDSPEKAAERSERRRMVLSALERLPEASREVLVLHYMEGFSTPRMATQLGLTEPAVRQRLRRARLLMQEEVTEMISDGIKDEAPGPELTDNVAQLLTRIRQMFQRVDYHTAVPLLESAREQDPQNTMVSLLLAEAYTFTRGPEDFEEDPGAYERAMALFDEVLEREPDNTLARLRRVALHSMRAPEEEVFAEQQRIAEQSRGGPFEAVSQLEVARRYLTRMQPEKALPLYLRLEKAYPWLQCVLHSEMGVAKAMSNDCMGALDHFKRAVKLTTPEAMAQLQETSRQLMGEAYWTYWQTVDNVPVRQCQNHAWLAGIQARAGDMKQARHQLKLSLDFLADDEVGPARPRLRREFVRQMEQMFPELANEPEVAQLRQEIEAAE